MLNSCGLLKREVLSYIRDGMDCNEKDSNKWYRILKLIFKNIENNKGNRAIIY